MSCADVLATRTSDWKCALMPSALATAGMIIVSGDGVFAGVDATGVTRLMLIDGLTFVVALPAMRADAVFSVIFTAPVCPPTPRPAPFAVTSRFVPAGATTPELGVTVSHGSVGVAVNVCPANSEPRLIV